MGGFLLTTGTILCIITGWEGLLEACGCEMRMSRYAQGRRGLLMTSIHWLHGRWCSEDGQVQEGEGS